MAFYEEQASYNNSHESLPSTGIYAPEPASYSSFNTLPDAQWNLLGTPGYTSESQYTIPLPTSLEYEVSYSPDFYNVKDTVFKYDDLMAGKENVMKLDVESALPEKSILPEK